METTKFELSDKQEIAYDALTEDNGISELVFGGGARGGKSYLGSFWVISQCVAKPGSAYLIAREELKTLKRTTLRTFFKVLGALKYRRDLHYHYNAADMVMTFANGSVVFFAELKRVPSDPEFDRIGSYDLTGAWLDESQEICKDAKDALQFRFTVMEGEGWVANPKTLYTCNPAKTWIYQDFWKPIIKEKQKIEGRHFITSLYSDNPYIDQEKYRKNVLRTNNKVKIERLLRGNFEYDDDPTKIFHYDKILDLFTNKTLKEESTHHLQKYISCDIARTGDDIVIMIWYEWQVMEVHVFSNLKIPETVEKLKEFAGIHGVPYSNIVVDADGMGIGVFDYIPGCQGFHNGGAPLQPKSVEYDPTSKLDYANLKTQCYFALAKFVNNGSIGIEENMIGEEAKEYLKEELDIVKQINTDSDKKTEIIKKEDVVEMLGRSPDRADAMMMRMFFEVPLSEGQTEITDKGKGQTSAGNLYRQEF